MKYGTDPETSKGYGLPSATERKTVANAKSVIEQWHWANREHESAVDITAPLLTGLTKWLDETKPAEPKPKSDTPTPESTLKPGNPMDSKSGK